ncbi:MAG: phenylalanine--tRNA ligase beta subunit-related protein [Ilumatobacter sp.]|uniref:B3/B4 domain-containing protein n=1 Tax=Ilumatobacter sp. TaxID=1967498 RepID=UPI0032977CD8
MVAMEVRVENEVFSIAPQYERVVLHAVGRATDTLSSDLADRFDSAVRNSEARFSTDEDVASWAEIAPWREAMQNCGWSASKFRSSIEALTRRAARGQLSPLGVCAVDAGTIATLESGVPIGVHVLDNLGRESLVLGPAFGNERFENFDGSTEAPDPGEIVYRAGRVCLTRRWVWRQGRVGSVVESSKTFAINIDLIDAASVDVDAIVANTTGLFQACGLNVVATVRLSSESPRGHLQVPPSDLDVLHD